MRNTKTRRVAANLVSVAMFTTGLMFSAQALAAPPCGKPEMDACRTYWQVLGYHSVQQCIEFETSHCLASEGAGTEELSLSAIRPR